MAPLSLQLTNIYDAKTEQLHIGPYFWRPFPYVDFWLEQDDKQILQVPETGSFFPPFSWVGRGVRGLMGCQNFPQCTGWGGWEIMVLKGRIIENFVFQMSSSSCPHLVFQNLSTSPLAEPPHFVSHIRSTLTFLKEHPFPSRSLFPDRKPRIYKKNEEGLWEQVCSDRI